MSTTRIQSVIYQRHYQCTRHDLISYRYQSEAHNYQCQIKGHNPLNKTMNHRNMFCDQSTLLLLGAIWLAIHINRKLTTINSKSNNTIHKTENDYSLAVNNTEFLYQLRFFFFSLNQNWVSNRVITSYALLYITYLNNHNMGTYLLMATFSYMQGELNTRRGRQGSVHVAVTFLDC